MGKSVAETRTPGSWTYHIGIDYTQFYDANDEAIFLVKYAMPEPLAALIAAAPDMLEALEALESGVTDGGSCRFCRGGYDKEHEEYCRIFKARAAIAKAKGEA